MAKHITIPTREGILLKTKGTYVDEDINIVLDPSIIPDGTLDITASGVYDVENYKNVDVKITALKPILDITKTCDSIFREYTATTSVDHLIAYNDTANVVYFSNFFFESTVHTIPKLNTDAGAIFNYMFYNSRQFKSVDMSHYYCANSNNSKSMFAYCTRLKTVIIRSFGEKYTINNNAFESAFWLLGTYHETYNPNSEQGYFYVPRAVIGDLRNGTNWGQVQFRVLEDYTVDGTTTGDFDYSRI